MVKQVLDVLIAAADEAHGQDIRTYDVQGHSPLSDYVVVVSVKTHVHAKAVSMALEAAFQKVPGVRESVEFFPHARISGEAESGWMVLDFNSIIVHLAFEDVRDHYGLDGVYANQGIVYYN